MPKPTPIVLVLLAVVAQTSCIRLRSRPVYGYAPIVQMADNVSWPINVWEKKVIEEREKEAKLQPPPPRPKEPAPIQAEAAFIAAKPGRLQELGIRLDQPCQIISDRERAKILTEAMSASPPPKLTPAPWEAPPGVSPKLPPIRLEAQPTAPGGKLFLQRVMKFPVHPHFVKNVEVKTDFQYAGEADTGGEVSLDARFLSVSDGTALALQVELDGRTFIVTQIEPKVVAFLGSRSVTAQAEVDGKEREIFWQEPAVLAAVGQVRSPCEIRVDPGQSLLLPLRHTLLWGKAASRDLAKPGTIREEFDRGTRDLRHPDPRGYPLRNDVFVILTLKFAEPKKPAQ